jgi:multisubunit Na+/H+ antiporter MnhG subunit
MKQMNGCIWRRNLHTLILAVSLVLFFYAVIGILKRLSNNSDSYTVYFGILVVSLVIFALNGSDGSIGELLGQYPSSPVAAAAAAQ